jgi:hypothetical protein
MMMIFVTEKEIKCVKMGANFVQYTIISSQIDALQEDEQRMEKSPSFRGASRRKPSLMLSTTETQRENVRRSLSHYIK